MEIRSSKMTVQEVSRTRALCGRAAELDKWVPPFPSVTRRDAARRGTDAAHNAGETRAGERATLRGAAANPRGAGKAVKLRRRAKPWRSLTRGGACSRTPPTANAEGTRTSVRLPREPRSACQSADAHGHDERRGGLIATAVQERERRRSRRHRRPRRDAPNGAAAATPPAPAPPTGAPAPTPRCSVGWVSESTGDGCGSRTAESVSTQSTK